MENEANIIPFLRSYYEAIKEFEPDDRDKFVMGIFGYYFDGEEFPYSGYLKVSFLLLKPNIDNSMRRYTASVENGKKGGRPPKEKPSDNLEKPNDNLTEPDPNLKKEKEKEKEKEKDKEHCRAEAPDNTFSDSVIDYLNKKTGKSFKRTSINSRKHINARRQEGWRMEDFKRAIDNTCEMWMGNDMERFLRPDTLFGTKFESYANMRGGSVEESGKYDIKPYV